MAITDYASLQASVANWLHRTDLAAMIPDFIALAEAKLSSDLDARPMEKIVTLDVTGGDAWIDLPDDMLEMRRLLLLTDPSITLKYATPDQIAQDYPISLASRPSVFAVIGSRLQLAPTPDADYTLQLIYRQRISALSDSNAANWLLSGWPNAYLYGALCAAQPYIVNDARLPTFQALYKEAVDGINGIDWYSGSTMRVRAR